jgi:hypothetical protein
MPFEDAAWRCDCRKMDLVQSGSEVAGLVTRLATQGTEVPEGSLTVFHGTHGRPPEASSRPNWTRQC